MSEKSKVRHDLAAAVCRLGDVAADLGCALEHLKAVTGDLSGPRDLSMDRWAQEIEEGGATLAGLTRDVERLAEWAD